MPSHIRFYTHVLARIAIGLRVGEYSRELSKYSLSEEPYAKLFVLANL